MNSNKLINHLTKILVALSLLGFMVYTSKLDFKLLIGLLNSPTLLCCSIIVGFSTMILSAWRWHLLNKIQNIWLTPTELLHTTYLGIAFNNLLPGGVGGDFYRFYFIYKRFPEKRSVATLTILFDRLTGLFGVFIAILLVMIIHFNFLIYQIGFIDLRWLLEILFFSVCCIFLCSTLFKTLTRNFATKLKNFNFILRLLNAIRLYRNQPIIIIKCLLISLIVQIIIASTCLLIARMMGFPSLNLTDYLLAIALAQILSLIPVAPGGFGIGEIAFANVMIFLRPDLSLRFATIFLAYRIICILPYLPGVFLFIFDKTIIERAQTKLT